MSNDNILDGHILNIVNSQEIHEQADLQNLLIKRGYEIPQATLSRRLKKLNIAKVSGIYKVIDFNVPSLPLVLNMQISESGIIVLHTHPGNANPLAAFFDNKYVNANGVLGTIAGDDTMIMIIKNKSDLKVVLKLIEEDFPYLKYDSDS